MLRGKLALRTGSGDFDCKAGLLSVGWVKRKCPFIVSVLAKRHPSRQALLTDSRPTTGPGILSVRKNHQSELGIAVFVEMATISSADHGCPVISFKGYRKSVLLGKRVDHFFAIRIIGGHGITSGYWIGNLLGLPFDAAGLEEDVNESAPLTALCTAIAVPLRSG